MIRKEKFSLDVNFKENLNPNMISGVVKLLFEFIIHQRHQVPIKPDLLRKRIEVPLSSLEDILNQSSNDDSVKEMKRKRELIKERRKEERFLRKTNVFLENWNRVLKCLDKEVNENLSDISQIALVIGTTPLSPKEIYYIKLPSDIKEIFEPILNTSNNPSQIQIKKASLDLFRSIMQNDELFQFMGKSLWPASIHLAILKKYNKNINYEIQEDDEFIHRPEFASIHRGHSITFNFLDTSRTKIINEDCCYVPIPMELCTPFSKPKISNSSIYQTPIRENSFSTRTRSISTHENISMELCTPYKDMSSLTKTPYQYNDSHINSELSINDSIIDKVDTALETLDLQANYEWFFASTNVKGFRDC